MSAAVIFNITTFRALFPAYANVVAYPDITLQAQFNVATLYVSNARGGCYCLGMTVPQLTQALNLMTAHLLYLAAIIASSPDATTGLMQAATIDKVSVTLTPPPEATQWQWWLNQSPYGQQLLALLQVVSVGGCYIGGNPVLNTFRRIPLRRW